MMKTDYLAGWDVKKEQQKADFMEHFEISTDSPSGLIWKKKPSKYSNKKIGAPAGTLQRDKRGLKTYEYWVVQFKNQRYPASHIVWYLYGRTIPQGMEIDHKDTNAKNNNIDNLRLAKRSQQCCNRKLVNVSFCNTKKKWIARIGINNKSTYLGAFSNQEEALACYNQAAEKIHGEFACLTT